MSVTLWSTLASFEKLLRKMEVFVRMHTEKTLCLCTTFVTSSTGSLEKACRYCQSYSLQMRGLLICTGTGSTHFAGYIEIGTPQSMGRPMLEVSNLT